MKEEIEKKPIAQILMAMKIGDEERFPIEQQCAVIQEIQRKQRTFRRSGIKWSQALQGLECVVVRKA